MARPVSWIFVLVAIWAASTSLGGEKAAPGAVEVHWHGQSFFVVKGKDLGVAFDPHIMPEYGRVEGVKADLVFLSHNHNDHTQISVLENLQSKDKPKIVAGIKGAGLRGEWELVEGDHKGAKYFNVALYHDSMQGMKYGKNTAFVVDIDGWRICHLGDLGHELVPEQIKKIGAVDVLMIPVGGIYSINGSEAKKVVEQLKPKEYIFPMHYGTKVFNDLLPIDEFLEDQDDKKVSVSQDNKVTLNKDADRPRPLIVQLHYWPKVKKN